MTEKISLSSKQMKVQFLLFISLFFSFVLDALVLIYLMDRASY